MLRARAPAKVNLTLHVLGRRADGFHELDSLVAFAGCAADALTLEPDGDLALDVSGTFADAAGEGGDNLVLKAARAAAERIEGLRLGRFALVKRIPVAAGLGGGSADAGAALRLIAEANGLSADDPRLIEAAAAVGSDVPVCLASRAARMTGRGEGIEPLEDFAPLAAVLANPMKGLATAEVFRALGLKLGDAFPASASGTSAKTQAGAASPSPLEGEGRVRGDGGAMAGDGAARTPHPTDRSAVGHLLPQGEKGRAAALDIILAGRNDLEPPACALMPEIGFGLDALAATQGCRLARMSGSGATVFGLFDDQRAARRAARALHKALPGWWIRPTLLR
jgi:4-diphosphocytidyl-2-C-methyl-D-erythritol kinase